MFGVVNTEYVAGAGYFSPEAGRGSSGSDSLSCNLVLSDLVLESQIYITFYKGWVTKTFSNPKLTDLDSVEVT